MNGKRCRLRATAYEQKRSEDISSTTFRCVSLAERPKPRALAFAAAFFAVLALIFVPAAFGASYTFIVSGLGGEPQYEERFRTQAEEIAMIARGVAERAEDVVTLVGPEVSRDAIRNQMRALVERVEEGDLVTIVLIGHGSYDGEDYRFNIPGQDITGSELHKLLSALRAREQLIVNATSASGAIKDKWSRPGRVLITATKSGGERTATRFAQYWAEALKAGNADANKDEIVSASEAFEFASRQVAAAFKADVALATEHPQIAGAEAASAIAVARYGSAAAVSSDPEVNAMLAQRSVLERNLSAVKERRPALSEQAYYDELENVLVEFARLQQKIDAKQAGSAAVQP